MLYVDQSKVPCSEITYDVGQRILICGQTGSGKTTLLSWLIQKAPTNVVLVLNTKDDDMLNSIATDHFDSIAQFKPETHIKEEVPLQIINIRPGMREQADPKLLDEALLDWHGKLRNVTLVIDEGYQVHLPSGRNGPGLMGWLTRGRSRGQTLLMGTQRPAWLSRFAVSESTHFAILRLMLEDDRIRMAKDTGYPEVFSRSMEKYKGTWITPDRDHVFQFFVVPYPEKE